MWHFRACKKYYDIAGEKQYFWCVVEYYPNVILPGEDKPQSLWSEKPECPTADTKEELIKYLEWMLEDVKHYEAVIDDEPQNKKGDDENGHC